MIKMRRTACLLTGAAGMYFFDPTQGKRRRARVSEQIRSRLAERQRAPQILEDQLLEDQLLVGDRQAEPLGA